MNSIINKFEAFLLTQKCCSVNTFNAYKADLKQFINFLNKQEVTFETMDEHHLKLFLKELKALVSSRSASRKISTLKVFFDWANSTLTWKNWGLYLTFPKVEKTLPTCLNTKEIEELLAVSQQDTTALGKRNFTMLYILYVTGLRISELISLTLSAVDLTQEYIKVDGKGGKQRIVPFSKTALQILEDYLLNGHKKFVTSHGNTFYLFPILHKGSIKHITRQAFWKILKDLCKKTSLKTSISPHVLRHSLATHLLKNGANLRSLQLLLGHETISTVQIYTHLDMSYLRILYDKKHPRS